MSLNRLSLALTIMSLTLVACTSRTVPTQAGILTEPTLSEITKEPPPTKVLPTATATHAPSPTATPLPGGAYPTETPLPPYPGQPAGETTPYQEPPPPPTPTRQPDEPTEPGAITGEICSPEENIPPMTVYFENVETWVLSTLPIKKGQSSYSLDLDPGQYIAYAYEKHAKAKGGLYSQAVPCGLTAGCTDHNPVVFTVDTGQTLNGIDICDWSAPETVPANPAPVDERLAGMVYRLYEVNYFRYDNQGRAQFLMSTPFDLRVSPDGKHGVFKDDEKNDLFLVDFSTGEQFNLTNSPQIQESTFWWVPRPQERILFRAFLEGEGAEPGYNGMLSVVDVDGSNLHAIEREHGPYYVSVSRNGRMIAFGGGETAFMYDWASGVSKFNPREYSTDLPEDLFISSPSWSPDGKKIVWHLQGSFSEQYQRGYGIFDLKAKTLLLVHPYQGNGYGGYPPPARWSPDGKWLAVDPPDPVPARNGTWLVKPSQPESEVFLGESTYVQVWSPDGKWLAYSHRDSSATDFYQVWIVNANQPEQRALMAEFTFGPMWSPDGKWLVYHRDPSGPQDDEDARMIEVWLYNPNTGGHEKTSLPPGARAVDW
ncbi:MAG TPA: hypothetical protein VI776_15025 [Anaerolineales bacterium]|nr:hypothetical protein [Anaerolineales bacterium]